MDYAKDLKNRDDAVNLAFKFIGDILGRMSIADMVISNIISNYLSNHVNATMYILNSVPLNRRLELFKKVISDTKYANDKYTTLIDDINKMNALRNKFAHSILRIPQINDYSKLKHINLNHFRDLNDSEEAFNVVQYPLDGHMENLQKLIVVNNELSRILSIQVKLAQ